MAVYLRFADVDGKPACVPVWDVEIHRGDGEGVRLHPNQTNKKVSISMVGALSDGRGTFKRMLAKTHTEVVPATNSVATASSADTRGDRAPAPRGDGADWRGWHDWRGAWSSDDNPRSAWSSDGAWHAWSSDDSGNWRGAWNSDDNWNWRGAWNSDDDDLHLPMGAPPAGQS